MKHENCIFVSEEDCPKNAVGITCEQCFKNRYYDTINFAVKDFTGLGASFTDVFILFKQLIDGNGKTVKIETPVDSMFAINRVMTAILGIEHGTDERGNLYKRLMFYFFSIVIDEFNNAEYKENQYLH